MIVLHAISHSLHTHSPVPQFLPHPHAALEHLVTAIEDHLNTFATSPLSNGSPGSLPMSSIQSTLVASSLESYGNSSVPMDGPALPVRKPGNKLGLSFAFALAENEAISEAVQTLSDIVETCKDLYGVASFIQQDDLHNLGENMSSFLHTPVRTPTRSARQSFSDSPRSPPPSSPSMAAPPVNRVP